jgi:nucleoside-diphosphate-sugar epimerase
MKVLFIGGTGNISTSATIEAVRNGHMVFHLNRGSHVFDHPGVTTCTADIHNPAQVQHILAEQTFDAVVNWIAFTPADIERDIRLFRGKTGQYIFISSASVYQKPSTSYNVTESTPRSNPYWEYSRNKIACEERLIHEYRETQFPVTIVRPSLTYGEQLIPLVINSWGSASYTVIDRMKRGLPVIVPGDGTSLWTITHADDFAKGICGLLGNQRAIGEAFHITSDEVLSWNQIYEEVGKAAGCTPQIIHIPTDTIIRFYPDNQGTLLGDKAVSTVFDNSKIKAFVPGFTATITWAQGVRRSIAWFEAVPGRIHIDQEANKKWDALITAWKRVFQTISNQ